MESRRTLIECFDHWVERTPNREFLEQPLSRDKREIFTWSEASGEVDRIVRGLQSLSLAKGDRVAILSKNCAHWILADLAIWKAGLVSVPIFPTLSGPSIDYILKHSGAKLVFVGKLDDWDGIKDDFTKDIPRVNFPYWDNSNCQRFESFVGKNGDISSLPRREEDELATIIYTSGTTGNPKGVMHSFKAMTFTGRAAAHQLGQSAKERFISYLPLCHVVERTLIESQGLYSGGKIFFVESLDTFGDDLRHTRPTFFMGVPRIWEKMQQKVHAKLPPKKLERLLKVPVLSGLIKKKIIGQMGLDQVRWAFTGGSAMPVSLSEWYGKLGIRIREGYGLTENLGYSNFSISSSPKRGTVGHFLLEVEGKLGENQEVLSRSPANMMGYYKDEISTLETLQDGFLRTGDKGEVDEFGNLKLVGRLKENFKTSKGKYIVPGRIESLLIEEPLVESACIIGEGLPQPIALVSLPEGVEHSEETIDELTRLQRELNKKLEIFERFSHMVVVDQPWSVEGGELTPTLKVKRTVIENRWSKKLNRVTASEQSVLLEANIG